MKFSSCQNWEHGRLFSLQEQIDHKVTLCLLMRSEHTVCMKSPSKFMRFQVELIKQELQNNEVPIVLVRTHASFSYVRVLLTSEMLCFTGKKGRVQYSFNIMLGIQIKV